VFVVILLLKNSLLANCQFLKLTSLTWLTVSWFVGELCSKHESVLVLGLISVVITFMICWQWVALQSCCIQSFCGLDGFSDRSVKRLQIL